MLAFVGLALALDPRGGNLDIESVALAFVGALGLGTVIAISSRVFRAGDSRPVTLYMAAIASVLLIAFCAAHGKFVLPQTSLGWVGFVGAAAFYAFAMIAFFIAVSMIGPVRASLLSYAEPISLALSRSPRPSVNFSLITERSPLGALSRINEYVCGARFFNNITNSVKHFETGKSSSHKGSMT
jgi:drug/metabolite transporter (DMT)-like permease